VLTDKDRQAELLKYFPNAKPEDWKLITAGQRVQVIKRDPEKGPILQFGTEIVTDQDKTIAALLGASPGASTSPPIMLELLAKAFPQQMADGWQQRLKEIVPSYGQSINSSAALTNQIRGLTSTWQATARSRQAGGNAQRQSRTASTVSSTQLQNFQAGHRKMVGLLHIVRGYPPCPPAMLPSNRCRQHGRVTVLPARRCRQWTQGKPASQSSSLPSLTSANNGVEK
jgi:hypothetical protein